MWQGKVLRSAIYSIRIVKVVNLSLSECPWKDVSLSFNPFLMWVVANHCACGIYFSGYSAIPFLHAFQSYLTVPMLIVIARDLGCHNL